jgi:putative transposase
VHRWHCRRLRAGRKQVEIKRHRYQSRDQARLSIFRYIETFYNPRRRHSSLGGISPDEREKRFQNRLQRKERLIQY